MVRITCTVGEKDGREETKAKRKAVKLTKGIKLGRFIAVRVSSKDRVPVRDRDTKEPVVERIAERLVALVRDGSERLVEDLVPESCESVAVALSVAVTDESYARGRWRLLRLVLWQVWRRLILR